MSAVFGLIILVRIIWWVAQSQSAGPRVRIEEPSPEENHVPKRPQLGGYGVNGSEEHDA